MAKEEKEKLDEFDYEAKLLELTSCMSVPPDFIVTLDCALQEISAYSVDRQSGGYVCENMIKAKFEADCVMTYCYRQGLSDLVFSIDADMSALCGSSCVSI